MAAYAVAEIEITDPAAYEGYRPLAAAAVEKYGGRFLVRGGRTETVEGGWAPKRIVILEFPSMEKLRAFYDSPEYRKALAIRLKASSGRLIFVEGA
jgi:uncharacterized protein (DUF1330 family)